MPGSDLTSEYRENKVEHQKAHSGGLWTNAGSRLAGAVELEKCVGHAKNCGTLGRIRADKSRTKPWNSWTNPQLLFAGYQFERNAII